MRVRVTLVLAIAGSVAANSDGVGSENSLRIRVDRRSATQETVEAEQGVASDDDVAALLADVDAVLPSTFTVASLRALPAESVQTTLKELGISMKHRKKIAKALLMSTDPGNKLQKQQAALRKRTWGDPLDQSTHGTREMHQCNIEQVPADELSPLRFEQEYMGKKPIIIQGLTVRWAAHHTWTRESLLTKYGDRRVQYGEESYDDQQRLDAGQGGGKHTASLADFVEQHIDGRTCSSCVDPDCEDANTTSNGISKCSSIPNFGGYTFGATFLRDSVPELNYDFDVPPHFHSLHNRSSLRDPYLFLGGAGTGLGFHAHGHAWNAVVFGSKRWLIYPPGWMHTALKLDQQLSSKRWLHEIYPSVMNTTMAPLECVTEAGDLMYVPADWLHATTNLEPTIGVAVNLDDKDQTSDVQEPLQFHFGFNPRPSLESIGQKLHQRHATHCGDNAKIGRKVSEECIVATIELGICLSSEGVYGRELSGRVTEMGDAWVRDRAKMGYRLLLDAVDVGCPEIAGAEACRHGHFMLAMLATFSDYTKEKRGDNIANIHAIVALQLGFEPVGAMECFVALTATVRASVNATSALSEDVALRVTVASEAAIHELEHSGKQAQHAHTLRALLCSLTLAQKQWKRAIKLCKAATVSNPLDESAALRLGYAYLGRGLLPKAQQVFSAAASRFKGLCKLCNNRYDNDCCSIMDTLIAGAQADWKSVLPGSPVSSLNEIPTTKMKESRDFADSTRAKALYEQARMAYGAQDRGGGLWTVRPMQMLREALELDPSLQPAQELQRVLQAQAVHFVPPVGPLAARSLDLVRGAASAAAAGRVGAGVESRLMSLALTTDILAYETQAPAGEGGSDLMEDIDALAVAVAGYEAAISVIDISHGAGDALQLSIMLRYFHLCWRLMQLRSFVLSTLRDRFAIDSSLLVDLDALVAEAYQRVDGRASSKWAHELQQMPLAKRAVKIGLMAAAILEQAQLRTRSPQTQGGLIGAAPLLRFEVGSLLINLPDSSLVEQGQQTLAQLASMNARTEEEVEANSWARAWQAEQQLRASHVIGLDADCGTAATQALLSSMNRSSMLRKQPHLHRALRTRGEELVVSHLACGKDAAREVWRSIAQLGVLQSEYQRPKGALSPLIRHSKPFWDIEHDEAVASLPGHTALVSTIVELELQATTIISEFEALHQSSTGTEMYESDREQLTAAGGWSQLFLFRSGVQQEGCAALPATCELTKRLQHLRLPQPEKLEDEESLRVALNGHLGDVKLSRMEGGTEVKRHCGPTNQRIRLQLALSESSPASYIEVGGERRRWTKGKVLAFDDSYEHRVVTDVAAGVRTVLIVDIWHPSISDSALSKSLSCAPLLLSTTAAPPQTSYAMVDAAPPSWSQCEQWRLCTTGECLKRASQCSAQCASLYESVATSCEDTIFFGKAKAAREVLSECRMWHRWGERSLVQ